MSLLRLMVDEKHTLDEAALLVRRAGLEHLVTAATSDEVEALARAGDTLEMERVAYFIRSLREPADALRQFDGGASARADTKALAFQASRRP